MPKRVAKEKVVEVEEEPKKRSRKPAAAEARADGKKKRDDDADESSAPASAPRPVLTAMPRPVRDDELQKVGTQDDEPAAELPPAPPAPEAPSLDTEGASRCRCSSSPI